MDLCDLSKVSRVLRSEKTESRSSIYMGILKVCFFKNSIVKETIMETGAQSCLVLREAQGTQYARVLRETEKPWMKVTEGHLVATHESFSL